MAFLPRIPAFRRWQTLIIALRVLVFVPVVVACIYLLLHPAATIAIVTARTPAVEFVVQSPSIAALRLSGLMIRWEAGSTTKANVPHQACLPGLLEPNIGTRVRYIRFEEEPVRIELLGAKGQPAASFRLVQGNVPLDAEQSGYLVLEPLGTCAGRPESIFPIQGEVDIGQEMAGATASDAGRPTPLIEGSVEIYGRTIDLPGWLSTLLQARHAAGSGDSRRLDGVYIYPAAKLVLPPGSRIQEWAQNGVRRAWWGFAIIENRINALTINVSTEASQFAIFRPGSGTGPELLKIGMFAQLLNDPNLQTLQLLVALFAALMGIGMQLVRWVHGKSQAGAAPQGAVH